jgi:hypothetical protein
VITFNMECAYCGTAQAYFGDDLTLFIVPHPTVEDGILAAAIVFACREESCSFIPDQVKHVNPTIAFAAIASGVLPVVTDILPEGEEPKSEPATIRITCGSCETEHSCSPEQLSLRVADGIRPYGSLEGTCSTCGSMMELDGLDQAHIALFMSLGIPRVPWARHAFAFPCGECGEMAMTDVVLCVSELGLPTREGWTDTLERVTFGAVCASCAELNLFPIPMPRSWDTLLEVFRALGFDTALPQLTWACDSCGTLQEELFRTEGVPMQLETFVYHDGNESLLMSMTCPKCFSFFIAAELEPEVLGLLAHTAIRWVTRLHMEEIDLEEAEQLLKEIEDAEPDDFR